MIDAFAKAKSHLPILDCPMSLGSLTCLGLVVEGLAWLGRYDEAAALQPQTEHAAATGPLFTFGSLSRTSAGIAAACGRNWSRAEEHHLAAIHQADTAPYPVAQPVARYWYADMLLARAISGDNAKARALLSEALQIAASLGMHVYARRASERLASLREMGRGEAPA